MEHLSACKLCQSDHLIRVKEYRAAPGMGSLWRELFCSQPHLPNPLPIGLAFCTRCGFIFYQDVFTFAELEQLYREENRYAKPKKHQLKPGRQQELTHFASFIDDVLPRSEVRKVLDIGSGDFVTLERLVKLHPSANYESVDPSYPHDYHKNIPVHRTMIEKWQPKHQYDLVTLIHVLEHVGEINGFMKKVSGLVGKNGYLYVEVPFQVGPSLFLNRAVNVQHINYYTPSTIRYLVEKQGFSVISLKFENFWYRYNGMPGMIRLLAEKKPPTALPVPPSLAGWGHLLNPWPILRSKFYHD